MTQQLQWRRQWDYTADAEAREATDIRCDDESLTVQDPTGEQDVNVMMRRMGVKDGSVLPGPDYAVIDPSYYGDFTEQPNDLAGAFALVQEAQDRFSELPHDIKNRFNQNPAQLYRWVSDQRNAEEAVKLGLLHRRAIPEPEPPKAAPVQNTPSQ